jgi:D-alanyl-D-alanine carboxypeptidase (penicillin-binding protein 5/6)
VAIAEHIGAELLGWSNDSEQVMNRNDSESKEAMNAFIACMNAKARELQCYNTWFITPNGLDGTETFFAEDGTVAEERFHSTTATELARIMSYCMLQSTEKEMFLKITGTYSYDFTDVEKTRSFVCKNHNAFLNMMQGAISGKTGYTGRAGYCYVGALERDGRWFVVALLNSGAYGSGNKGRKWQDTRKLMNYGLEHFKIQTIYEGNTVSEPVLIKNAKPEKGMYYEEIYSETVVAGDRPVKMLLADWEKTEVIVEQIYELTAPVRTGQTVGKVDVLLNDMIISHYDIICTEDIKEKKFQDTIEYLCNNFFLVQSNKK